MFTTVYIGNSRTKVIGGKMVTPRGYQVLMSMKKLSCLPERPRDTGSVNVLCRINGRQRFCGNRIRQGNSSAGTESSYSCRTAGHEADLQSAYADSPGVCVLDATHPYADEVTKISKKPVRQQEFPICGYCGKIRI